MKEIRMFKGKILRNHCIVFLLSLLFLNCIFFHLATQVFFLMSQLVHISEIKKENVRLIIFHRCNFQRNKNIFKSAQYFIIN